MLTIQEKINLIVNTIVNNVEFNMYGNPRIKETAWAEMHQKLGIIDLGKFINKYESTFRLFDITSDRSGTLEYMGIHLEVIDG